MNTIEKGTCGRRSGGSKEKTGKVWSVKDWGEKKYLIRRGERVVMLDTEFMAMERVVSRDLIERIELEATKNLWKMQETDDVEVKQQEN